MVRTTKLNTRTFATFIVISCILLAGCSDWSSDSPVNNGDLEDDDSDDLEDVHEEANDDGNGEVDEDNADDDEMDEDEDTSETGVHEGDDTDAGYASPNDIQVENVTHMQSELGIEHNMIALTNTNDELVLPIGDWEIEVDNQDQRIPIEEGTEIEPGDVHTVAFEEEDNVLRDEGGVIHLYDAEENHIGSWDYIGSPSAPPESDNEDETEYAQFQVIDRETSEEIEDAEITLVSGDNQLMGTTDGAGVTTIREVPHDEYEIMITHDEYADYTDTITIDETGTEMTIELEPFETSMTQTVIDAPMASVSM